jgi:hypothetical protein
MAARRISGSPADKDAWEELMTAVAQVLGTA